MKYKLTEIGFDSSIHTENELIEVAINHCNSYDDRLKQIKTLKQAIKYFETYGFIVEIIGA